MYAPVLPVLLDFIYLEWPVWPAQLRIAILVPPTPVINARLASILVLQVVSLIH